MKPFSLWSASQPIFVSLCFTLASAFSGVRTASAQSAFVDFNNPGELLGNFTLWNDVGNADGGNYDFAEGATSGVGGSGGVNVFQSTDTTAVYRGSNWNLAANGATIELSVLMKANGQSSGNKVQLGFLNSGTNGLNSNPGIAFESFRVIPNSDTVWSLREQFRTADATTETILGMVTVSPGRWYQFQVSITNTDTGGSPGSYGAGCSIVDFGLDGLTPGTNVVTFPTAQSHTGQTDVAASSVWAALRAFQNGGIDAWDNFLVSASVGPPVFAAPLGDRTVTAGTIINFQGLAYGQGPITYTWFTNGAVVAGVLGSSYSTPPVDASFRTVAVVASNTNGAATNSATITIFVPTPPAIVNFPATGVEANVATLSGQVTSTGGLSPAVTLYYGPVDAGTNAGAWAQNVALGIQTGVFTAPVSGLSSNATYYFTASAANSAGIAWATPSKIFTTLATNPIPTGVAVLTHHNDLGRTGANLNETRLNTGNVNTNQFGLLYALPVDDQIYAQPLLMTNVDVPGKGPHNLLIVATVNDSLYAFDADGASASPPLWQVSFLGPNAVAIRNSDMTGACGGGYQDFSGRMGIVGTPVIDPASATVYLVVRTKENGSTFVQRLHALDVATGADRSNSPIVITATYPGTGDGNVNNVITFDPQKQNQRPGLALVNGVVYISWSSHCDWGPYHGWVIGYDAATLQQTAVYNDTPNGYNGGIWMSGQPPAADAEGNLYLTTGNGAVGDGGDPRNTINRGESFLKLSPSGGQFTLSSWFTPFNWQDLENGDVDLGSGGVLLIPGTKLILSGGKQGVLYLLNRDNMGGLSEISADTNAIESIQVTFDQIHGGPIWWDGPAHSYAYIWPASDQLQQYQFDPTGGTLLQPAFARSPTFAPNGQPGGILSLSANGAIAGSGIVWASHQLVGDANQSVRPGILRAYDAQEISRELWNSDQSGGSDSVGNFAKFVPPTVANGRVYLPTFSNRVNVYGLLPPPVLAVSPSGQSVVVSWPENTSLNYRLQTTELLSPAAWNDATNRITATNGTFQAIVPAVGNSSFYRLIH